MSTNFIPLIFTAFSAVSQMVGNAQEAKVAKQNSKIAKQNANNAIAEANEDARRHRLQAYRQRALLTANYAANGLSVSEGSPLEVIAEDAENAELDALAIERTGRVRAQGFKMDAFANNQLATGTMSSGIIGGLSQLGQGYYRYSQDSSKLKGLEAKTE